MKKRLSWIIFLFMGFIILIINNPSYLKKFPILIRELRKTLKRKSEYSEDGDYLLVHKNAKTL